MQQKSTSIAHYGLWSILETWNTSKNITWIERFVWRGESWVFHEGHDLKLKHTQIWSFTPRLNFQRNYCAMLGSKYRIKLTRNAIAISFGQARQQQGWFVVGREQFFPFCVVVVTEPIEMFLQRTINDKELVYSTNKLIAKPGRAWQSIQIRITLYLLTSKLNIKRSYEDTNLIFEIWENITNWMSHTIFVLINICAVSLVKIFLTIDFRESHFHVYSLLKSHMLSYFMRWCWMSCTSRRWNSFLPFPRVSSRWGRIISLTYFSRVTSTEETQKNWK